MGRDWHDRLLARLLGHEANPCQGPYWVNRQDGDGEGGRDAIARLVRIGRGVFHSEKIIGRLGQHEPVIKKRVDINQRAYC